MKMRVINYLLIFILILKRSWGKEEMKFTDLDLRAMGRLTRHLGAQCVVFVEDCEDLTLISTVKTALEGDVFRTVVNATFLENILANNKSQLSFFQRRTLIVTKQKLRLTKLLRTVSLPFYLTWLIFEDYSPSEEFYIPVSSKVIFVSFHSPGIIYAKQVYHLKRGIKEEVKVIWKWDLDSDTDSLLEQQKLNFNNVSLDMLALSQREGCKNFSGAMLLKKLECIHQQFLHMMGKRLKFSINLVECMEKEFPFTYPNGTDSELFLRLKNREVDFSAVSHIVRTQRKRHYMDYVWPTFVLKSMMYLKQGTLAGRWASYLRPLESSVWWSILTWILFTGILILIFEKLLMNKLKFNIFLALDLIMSTLKALQVFCNQALSDVPTAYSIRIIFLLKFFVVLIFFQSYCGYLVSSLTVAVSAFPFKDLKGFFENRQYQIMTLRRGFHQFYVRKVIGEGKREDFLLPQEEFPETLQEAIDKLCTETHLAFVEFREDLLNFATLGCRISELPSPIASLYMGIAVPTGSPLKEFLKRELLHLRSTGIAQRLGAHLSLHLDFRDPKSRDEFTNVSMTYIFSIFILLMVGVLMSIIILVIEMVTQKFIGRVYRRRE